MAPSDITLLRDLVPVVAFVTVLGVVEDRMLTWFGALIGLGAPVLLLIIRFATSIEPLFDASLGNSLAARNDMGRSGGVKSRNPYCFLVCRNVL